ncbi:GIY-YIG nuclease family protein [Streptomyces canus]|uniref:GIY-YIG nuclease family protein n=1 Tax=Streptomyces canus TaxID=58343 RepID=UPI00368ED476
MVPSPGPTLIENTQRDRYGTCCLQHQVGQASARNHCAGPRRNTPPGKLGRRPLRCQSCPLACEPGHERQRQRRRWQPGWPEGELMEEQVYVIGAVDSPVAKIGVSADPERRLRQIQAMSPLRLEILWKCTGGYPLEGRLHARLRAYHSHGEWFDFQDRDPVAVVQTALHGVGGEDAKIVAVVRTDPCPDSTVTGCICGHGSRLHGAGGCTVMGWDESHDCQCNSYRPTSVFDDETVPLIASRHPLALSTDIRFRLGRAVRELLDAPGLVGAPDSVRLAVLVLAARAPRTTGLVEITSRELGQWLGLSVSHMQSVVLPGLRHSGSVATRTLAGEFGEDRGVECEVLPFRTARDVLVHSLDLSHEDLATWQRLMEALLGPGQPSPDGQAPPGLVASRTGRGASTDRLALLLLVLEAADTGRVRLCGGAVDKHRGRAAATVARLLGCRPPGAERVLKRLEDAGLIRRPRQRTTTGLHSRTRLVVPAVAAAHRK